MHQLKACSQRPKGANDSNEDTWTKHSVMRGQVKFRKPVVPGDRLDYQITTTKRRESVSEDGTTFTRVINNFSAKAYVDGVLVCECTMSAMMAPKENSIA